MFVAREPVVWTPSPQTHGHGDHFGERRIVRNRPVVKLQEQAQGRNLLVGGCGIFEARSPELMIHASLQASRAMAYQEISSKRIKGSVRPEDRRARGVLVQNAEREVDSSIRNSENFILHPTIGKLRKRYICLHPSVGRFKRDRVNSFDFESAGTCRLESRTRDDRPGLACHQQCRGPAPPKPGWRASSKP